MRVLFGPFHPGHSTVLLVCFGEIKHSLFIPLSSHSSPFQALPTPLLPNFQPSWHVLSRGLVLAQKVTPLTTPLGCNPSIPNCSEHPDAAHQFPACPSTPEQTSARFWYFLIYILLLFFISLCFHPSAHSLQMFFSRCFFSHLWFQLAPAARGVREATAPIVVSSPLSYMVPSPLLSYPEGGIVLASDHVLACQGL